MHWKGLLYKVSNFLHFFSYPSLYSTLPPPSPLPCLCRCVFPAATCAPFPLSRFQPPSNFTRLRLQVPFPPMGKYRFRESKLMHVRKRDIPFKNNNVYINVLWAWVRDWLQGCGSNQQPLTLPFPFTASVMFSEYNWNPGRWEVLKPSRDIRLQFGLALELWTSNIRKRTLDNGNRTSEIARGTSAFIP